MCVINDKGVKTLECNKCICSKSANHNQHNKVPTGEKLKVWDKDTGELVAEVPTYKCGRGCGSYQY